MPPSQFISTAPRLKLADLVMITSTAPVVETLGPVTALAPGGVVTHTERWSAFRGVRVERWTDEELDRVVKPLVGASGHGVRLWRAGDPLATEGTAAPTTLVVQELLSALQLQIRVDFRRFCLGEVGVLLVDGRLVGVGFNAEQEIAGLDLLPFGEVALVDETGDPSDNVDLVNCRHAADEISG